ncbi:amino acid ABC transporter substrate-binding protein [Caulobacter mirabilis]|uniref:Amino acid ABC transporter substrate-binding protein n=1 Tax=Caulobacter mirabilis TaxID=69666 RepID=A0A2D2AXT2_9CAUL|nr:amino acid ABC transporter substrate-binding protein [Caulobacter mirabilis]ATQ42818.1 amino acid ABC transporter substrate-binding protein [Caulobacter mirabilis]
MKRAALLVLLSLSAAACERKPAPVVVPEDAAPVTAAARDATAASPTLKAVKARGVLRCGVNPGLAGFAQKDAGGRWRGFDVDFCRAVAAAVLGDPGRVEFVPLTTDLRFAALKGGQVDLLSRNTSWTFTRDAGEAIDFAGVSYYDGQGFLAPKSLELQSAAELSGAKVCVLSGSTTEANLRDWFKARSINWTPVQAKTEAALRQAYQREDCDVLSADVSALASARATLTDPAAHVLLPDVISKEPLGPAVRQGDPGWTDVVRWTLNALILAEELGVTAKDADRMAEESTNPEVRRLLGSDTGYGGMLGLDDRWALRAIKAVGNYGELFERDLGADSALKLERGMNAPWNAAKPGLMYAPPIR